MNDIGIRLEEWKSLRQELASKQEFCEKIVLSTVGVNLAVYAFAMQKADPSNAVIVLALPPLVGSIAYYWLLANAHSAHRIVLYVVTEVESTTALNWETFLLTVRQKPKQTQRLTPYTLILIAFYLVSALASLWCIWIDPAPTADAQDVGWRTSLTLATSVLLGVMGYCFKRFFFTPKNREIGELKVLIRAAAPLQSQPDDAHDS